MESALAAETSAPFSEEENGEVSNERIALLKVSFDESITERKTAAFWKGVIAQLTSNSNHFIDMSGVRHSAAAVVFHNGAYESLHLAYLARCCSGGPILLAKNQFTP